jgi:ABC-type transporter Mla maintaining outer membrane lipid asymmetry permease subunit MlaE
VSFISGCLGGLLLGMNTGDPEFFFKSLFSAIRKADVFNLMLKSFIPGLLMGSICCIEGLSVQSSFTEVPQATSRAVVRSTLALFISAAVISVMTYV